MTTTRPLDLLGPGLSRCLQERRPRRWGRAVASRSRWPLGEVHEVGAEVTPRAGDFQGTTLAAEILAPEPVGPLLFLGSTRSWQMGFEREREQPSAGSRAVRGTARRPAQDARRARRRPRRRTRCGEPPLPVRAPVIGGRERLLSRRVGEHPRRRARTHLHTRAIRSSLPGETAWDLDRRIDYIFVRCDEHGPTLDIRACARLFDQPVDGVWASDHFGVVADLAVPMRERPFHA